MKAYLILLLFLITTIGNAQLTNIPDSNFEAYLEANGMGNGVANDHYVTTTNINDVYTLDVSSQNIANLTGIEDFTSLTNLHCEDNVLTALNVSANTGLTTLYCHTNSLSEIDISQNVALKFFYCNLNSINILNLEYNINLLTIECSFNNLTSLDVSKAVDLIYLDCGANQIISLDLTNNYYLEHVYMYNNSLTEVDLRNINNMNISGYSSLENPNLFCVYVDNIAWSETNWTNVDAQTNYLVDESACTAGVKTLSDNLLFNLYPNPTKNSFVINSNKIVLKVELYSILGKLVKTFSSQDIYTVSDLQKGIYLVTINSKNAKATKKLILK